MNKHFTTFLTDTRYKRLLYRRRACKRFFLLLFVFLASIYFTILIRGDMRTPEVLGLSSLNRCPACYGVSVCPELYSNQVSLEYPNIWSVIFNAKNLYYGYTKVGRRVILKKLAHKRQLKEFDANLCNYWGLKRNCKPLDIVNATGMEEKILDLVYYNISWPETKPRNGLIMCPYHYTIGDFVLPAYTKNPDNHKFDTIYIWTMLYINPEPLILMAIPKSKGYPVPAFGGLCGRLELVANEGEPISSLMHVEWHRKLKYAIGILNAAMDFTFKHDRYRFYLMDWSLDNIVANDDDVITFVDLEDVIVLDKHILPEEDLPNWYQRYNRDYVGPDFAFSIADMCKHHLSDHNIWAACYVLAGHDKPLLYPIPDHIQETKPHLHKLLYECLNNNDRFQTVNKLLVAIRDMLSDESVIGYGGKHS